MEAVHREFPKDRQHAEVNDYNGMGKTIRIQVPYSDSVRKHRNRHTHRQVNTYVVDASAEYGQNK